MGQLNMKGKTRERGGRGAGEQNNNSGKMGKEGKRRRSYGVGGIGTGPGGTSFSPLGWKSNFPCAVAIIADTIPTASSHSPFPTSLSLSLSLSCLSPILSITFPSSHIFSSGSAFKGLSALKACMNVTTAKGQCVTQSCCLGSSQSLSQSGWILLRQLSFYSQCGAPNRHLSAQTTHVRALYNRRPAETLVVDTQSACPG